jgi:hypothetical protein
VTQGLAPDRENSKSLAVLEKKQAEVQSCMYGAGDHDDHDDVPIMCDGDGGVCV